MTSIRQELLLSGDNRLFLEELYQDFLQNPQQVDEQWRTYFSSVDRGDFSLPVEQWPTENRPKIEPPRAHLPNKQINSMSNGGSHGASSFTSALRVEGSTSSHLALPSFHPLASETEEIEFKDLSAQSTRVELLQRLQLFSELSEDNINRIAPATEELTFEANQYIFREGTVGEDLYILISGYVLVEQKGRFVVELGPGEVIGELSALDGKTRSADIRTRTKVQTLVLRGKDFIPLIKENSSLMMSMLRILIERVRDTHDKHDRVARLVRAFRVYGHLLAKINPLDFDTENKHHYALNLEEYNLSELDLDTRFSVNLGGVSAFQPLRSIIAHLKETYCGAVGVQYMHIDDPNIQKWVCQHLEDPIFRKKLNREKQLRILGKLTDAEVFETFLHSKYLGAKRFSLEGSESLIPLLDEAIEKAGEHGVKEIVIGMAHRGRLNVLANILEKPADQIFREFEDSDPELHKGKGDVKYHLGYSTDLVTGSGQKVHLSLSFNPSHLEAVSPVVAGRTRAKQDRKKDHTHDQVMSLIIHGDAAFIGQGVVQELFNLSELPGFRTGGTVHVIVNNQIGFTTNPSQARSSHYATDIARMLQIPVFHVNGEDPEAVDRVIQIAMNFRKTFRKDIVIDMYGYRKHGHNEGDEPAFTQPQLYQAIGKKPTVREAYVENLLKLGGITKEEADQIAEKSRQRLENELEEARKPDFKYVPDEPGQGVWTPYRGGPVSNSLAVNTAVESSRLSDLLRKLTAMPDEFHPHRKIQRFSKAFEKMAQGEAPLNWGAAESLAYCTLLTEGYPVRITGQDVERGTFSHRHAVLHDVENGNIFIPMQHLAPNQGRFSIYNSTLSEIAVLGFEFGYSLDYPDGLNIWEAQFGDFCNMAQVIIDQFISSSEEKWNRLSGLTMLLPHGFEGQGPEHSSARLERFLSLAAEDNMQIVNLTTPAQIFHCLRRQVHNPWRKPLIVMSPKSLLRHPKAVSSLEELSEGRFHTIIPDAANLDKSHVKRIILCTGKVYYDLEKAREERNIENIAILRVEQLYPFPFGELQSLLKEYNSRTPVVWVQEEPENMGAWPFVLRTFGYHIGGEVDHPLHRVSRLESASPATGSKASHDLEQQKLIDEAFDLG